MIHHESDENFSIFLELTQGSFQNQFQFNNYCTREIKALCDVIKMQQNLTKSYKRADRTR